jgi:DNA-binding XRE family transcriptional regulator
MEHEEYRARRKALGMTQQQLAEELGITRDTIIAREAGTRRLTGEHFHALRSIELACKALEGKQHDR